MNYEETIELEENIKIKNRVDELYKLFLNNVKLSVKTYKNGRFCIWSDSHNAKYIKIEDDVFVFQCEFLHERYVLRITPSFIFDAIKNKNRVIDHFESTIKYQL